MIPFIIQKKEKKKVLALSFHYRRDKDSRNNDMIIKDESNSYDNFSVI